MIARTSLMAAIVLLAGCAAPATLTPTAVPTREPGTVTVNALLDLGGSRGPLGSAQRDALQLFVDQQNARAGAPRIRVKTVDVGASDARLIIELRRAVLEDRASAVIIGTPLETLRPELLGAIELAQVPVLLTVATAPPPTSSGKWLFSLAPPADRLGQSVTIDLALRGIGEPLRLDPKIAETFTVPAQLTGVRGLVLAGPPREYPRIAGLLKAALPPPRTYLSHLTDPGDMGDFRDASLPIVWPGWRHVVGGAPPGQSAAQREFVRTYTDRRGPPSSAAATAFDALALLAAAAERGGGEPAGLRDRLEESRFAGVATTYSFGPVKRAGADPADIALLRWSGSFVSLAG